MHARSITLAVSLIACAPTTWAMPTHETFSGAADSAANFFSPDPTYVPLLDVSTTSGVAAQITGTSYTASANTTLGSNHAYASASSMPSNVLSAGSFSGWYDQVTITGGTGTGTAQFTVQLNGSVDVGAIAGMVGYGLVTSSVHPSVLGTDIIIGAGTPTSPWFLIANEVNPIIEYGIAASPYNNPDQLNGLFGAPQPSLSNGIPAIDNPTNLLGGDAGMGLSIPDQVFTPGVGQNINITLYGTLNFTYDKAFYLIGTLGTNLFDPSAFQSFCSFDIECPATPLIDGTGATTLDFSNSANLVGIVLPQGASAEFASGNDYNVTAVPEPAEWLMLLTGLGLVGWRARRRN